MRSMDRNAFDALLDKLGRHFPERKITPELRRDYWDALCRLDLALIERFANQYIATGGEYFPRVSKLQPAGTQLRPDVADTAKLLQERADKESAAAWDEALRKNPQEARIRLRLAQLSRVQVSLPPDNPARLEAVRDAQVAQRELLKLWEHRRQQQTNGK